MLMQSASACHYYQLLLFCFARFIGHIPPTLARDVSFGKIEMKIYDKYGRSFVGILIRGNDEEDIGSAVRTAIAIQDESNNLRHRTMITNGTGAMNIGKQACPLINSGQKMLMATGDWKTHSTLTTISQDFNIPYINWASPLEGPGRHEISVFPPLHYAIADLVVHKNWNRLIYVFDSEGGVWNQRALVNHLKSMKHQLTTLESVRLPRWESNGDVPDYFRFFLDFHARYFLGDHYVILDVDKPDILKQILLDLQDVAMKTRNFHYLIASYDTTRADFNPFRNGLMNVTMLQLLDEESAEYQRVQNYWRDAYRAINHQDPPENRLLPRACLAYDSVLVIAMAVLEMEKRDRYRYDVEQGKGKEGPYCLLDSDDDSTVTMGKTQRNSQEFAVMLTRLIKRVRTSGLTGNIEFDKNGTRTNFELKFFQLEFSNTKEGPVGIIRNRTWRHKVGFVDQDQAEGFNVSSDISPMKKVIITTVLVDPFVMKSRHYDKYEHTDNNAKFEGYIIDLIKELSKKMGSFKYTIRLNPEGQYGSPQHNGTWNGMIGELISGAATMAIGPVTITRARERVVDFSKPFMTTGISIMIKKPDKQEFSVFSFLQPLSREVWMYIIFAYIGVSVVIFLISRFSPYEWRVEEGAHGTYTISNDFSIYNCLWFTLAAFMQQGTDILPRSVSGRIASSAWWFFTMIIVSSYTANLAAFLTMEKMRAPIESVDDLVKQTKIKYGIQRGGSTANFFQESPLQVHKRMSQFMNSHKEEVMVKDYAEGIAKVRDSKGNYAFLLEATSNEYANTRKPCDTMKVGNNLNSLGYGVATPFGSPWRHRINLAILELQENGELKKLENKWWYEKAQCEQGMADSQSASLTLSKVAGIFYILLGGMIFAMMAAFGEFFHRSRKQAKKNRESSITCRDVGASTQLAYPTIEKS